MRSQYNPIRLFSPLACLASTSSYALGFSTVLPPSILRSPAAPLATPPFRAATVVGRGAYSPRRPRRSSSTSSVTGGMSAAAPAESSDAPPSPPGGGLFLFDFDGVVCDSCDECTISAWRTCKILKAIEGEEADSSSAAPPKWLFEKMREIRPAIEIGWQIPVLLSVFLEQQKAEMETGAPAMSVDDIISNYESLVSDWLTARELEGKDMVKTFGGVRDDWITDDPASWLDVNSFYDGISDGISRCAGEAVLVTTKQHRFATALVRHAGVDESALPEDRVYGLGQYKSKSDVIADRMKRGGYAPGETHFFEDRWPTLSKCLGDDRLDGVRFYLCSWGYCTPGELALAEAEPRVEVLKLEDFGKVVAM